MAIKKGDFVKINYTGKLSDGTVFDTTLKDIAEKSGLEGTKELSPIIICVGEKMLVPGLDEAMVGKDKEFSVTIKPEEAFGKKDPKLLKVVPTQQLKKQGINPQSGMQLNIDGSYGIVRSTGGGRTVVDFNHPLANQEVTYDVEIVETVEDVKEQVDSILGNSGVPYEVVEVNGEEATIKFSQMLPKPYLDAIQKRVTELTNVKTLSFEQGKREK